MPANDIVSAQNLASLQAMQQLQRNGGLLKRRIRPNASSNPQVTIEPLSEPGDLYYACVASRYGHCLLVWNEQGLCELSLADHPLSCSDSRLVSKLKKQYPKTCFREKIPAATRIIETLNNPTEPHPLCLNGTDFQLMVWRGLLNIPTGHVCTYSDLAQTIGKPKAVRAVASAVANNPVALLIPCHRVIPANGEAGNYRWGKARKAALLLDELDVRNQH
jgi:AraC family transcriptional regulator of adaptative response/methylated-DNA-[protein]-cysteine methyltransferase